MEKFLSCDWGSSTFRLRLVDATNLVTIEEEINPDGILSVHKLWIQSGRDEKDRLFFYQDFIEDRITELAQKLYIPQEVTLVISGMASSAIGMVELPYKELPLCTDGSDLLVKTIEASDYAKRKTVIVSGAKTHDDVMRGEETLLVGCITDKGKKDQLFIFPGTHSKHVRVNNEQVTHLKTYMTGEFFELLSRKSILSNSVDEGKGWGYAKNKQAFEHGVMHSLESNILHASFRVRTNDLLSKFSKEENYYYLSGLLIGTELNDLKNDFSSCQITIVGNQILNACYEAALNLFDLSGFLSIQDADEALVRGQWRILSQQKS